MFAYSATFAGALLPPSSPTIARRACHYSCVGPQSLDKAIGSGAAGGAMAAPLLGDVEKNRVMEGVRGHVSHAFSEKARLREGRMSSNCIVYKLR